MIQGIQPPTVSGMSFSGPDFLGYNIMRKDAQSNWQKSIDYETNMSNTQWQRGVKDMKAAGLNPMLAYQQGGASYHSGGQIQSVTPPGANAAIQLQTGAQVAALNAQADKTYAEADEVRARTPTHAVTREQLRQQIAESVAKIEDLKASVMERTASAARQYAQREVLFAELPRIAADTKRLTAQARAFVQQAHTGAAQESEIVQRVKANLPALEAAQRALDNYVRSVNIPGKELDAEARQSFIGIFGAYLRALNPLQGLLGHVPQ